MFMHILRYHWALVLSKFHNCSWNEIVHQDQYVFCHTEFSCMRLRNLNSKKWNRYRKLSSLAINITCDTPFPPEMKIMLSAGDGTRWSRIVQQTIERMGHVTGPTIDTMTPTVLLCTNQLLLCTKNSTDASREEALTHQVLVKIIQKVSVWRDVHNDWGCLKKMFRGGEMMEGRNGENYILRDYIRGCIQVSGLSR
jgi:hypothetical protein